jgi:hypothetical protein
MVINRVLQELSRKRKLTFSQLGDDPTAEDGSHRVICHILTLYEIKVAGASGPPHQFLSGPLAQSDARILQRNPSPKLKTENRKLKTLTWAVVRPCKACS